jgi:cytochrome c-type biogenesis protein CcmH/NrfF
LKKILEFLGQSINAHVVSGDVRDDRISVKVGNHNYDYSNDSDKEEIAQHASQLHCENCPDEKLEEVSENVRSQLDLGPKKSEVQASVPKIKKPLKKAKKASIKK